jgi:hypothetical protein
VEIDRMRNNTAHRAGLRVKLAGRRLGIFLIVIGVSGASLPGVPLTSGLML